MLNRKSMFVVAIVFSCCVWMMLAWTKNAQSAPQGSSASGLLTLNKDKINLTNAYVDLVNPEEPIIVLSDKPLPPDNFSIGMLSESYIRQKKVHAILFSLSPKEKRLSGSHQLFLFPGQKDALRSAGERGGTDHHSL